MRYFLMCLFLFLIVAAHQDASVFSAELVRTIGSDHEDNMFFNLTAGVVLEDGSVVVGDSKGYFIARYDRDGQLIKRFGRSGQGPGEFLMIHSLRFVKGYLYFYDLKNIRLAKLDPELNKMETKKLGNLQIRGDLYIIPEGRMLATFSDISSSQGRGRVALFNPKGELKTCFFTKDQWGEHREKKDARDHAVALITAKVLAGFTSSRPNEVVLGFEYPEQPEVLYVYDFKGRELKNITLPQKKVYRFPSHLLKFDFAGDGFTVNEVYTYILNQRIICYKEYILLIRNESETRIKGNRERKRTFCTVLDRNGVILGEFNLPKFQQVFDVNEQGMMVSTNSDDEIPKVYIHKLTF